MKLNSLPCYCATLRQAARSATAFYEAALADSGLHVTQYTILQLLDERPALATTELADAIGMEQSSATRTLALVKKSGLIADAAGADRRERRWTLTPVGRSVFRKTKPVWEAAQQAFEQKLGRAQAASLKRATYAAALSLAG